MLKATFFPGLNNRPAALLAGETAPTPASPLAPTAVAFFGVCISGAASVVPSAADAACKRFMSSICLDILLLADFPAAVKGSGGSSITFCVSKNRLDSSCSSALRRFRETFPESS